MLESGLYFACLGVLTYLAYRRPPVALVAYICMFGIEQLGQLYLSFVRSYGLFTNLYILTLVAVAVIYTILSGKLTLGFGTRGRKVRNFSVALFVFALVSLIWTPIDAWELWTNQWPYFFVSLMFAPLLINRTDDLDYVQTTLLWIGGAMMIFMAFIPEWGNRSLIISDTGEEIGLPLSLSQLSGYVLITASIFFRKSNINTAWLSIIIVAALVVLLRTGSRGQFIFSIFSVLVVTPLVWRRVTLKNAMQLMLVAGLIASVSFYAFDATVSFSGRWETGTMAEDLGARLDKAQILLAAWMSSPLSIIFGLGNSASYSTELVGRYPHIVPMEILGEEGIIGFGLFCALIVTVVRQALRVNSLVILSEEIRRNYAASFACFVFTLLLSFKQGSYLDSSMIFFFAVLTERYFLIIKADISGNLKNWDMNAARRPQEPNL